MTGPPLVYRWRELHDDAGEVVAAMAPHGRFAREASQRFTLNQTYFMGEAEERSQASHAHQFAWLRDAWASLPEHLSDDFPTPDHLRRHVLISAGFYNETRIDCGSNPAALRVAAVMRTDDPFAAVVVRGALVVRRVAKSQAWRSMDKAEFQASKTALMEGVAAILGVEPDSLSKPAEAHA